MSVEGSHQPQADEFLNSTMAHIGGSAFNFNEVSGEKPEPAQPTKEQLKEQLEWMDYLFQKGLYQALSPENFPLLPPQKVALTRFLVMNNYASGLINVMNTVNDSEVKVRLKGTITQVLIERDELLKPFLNDSSEIDEDLISRQAGFSMTGDQLGSFWMAVNFGMVDLLNEENFPIFGTLSENYRDRILYQAKENGKAFNRQSGLNQDRS